MITDALMPVLGGKFLEKRLLAAAMAGKDLLQFDGRTLTFDYAGPVGGAGFELAVDDAAKALGKLSVDAFEVDFTSDAGPNGLSSSKVYGPHQVLIDHFIRGRALEHAKDLSKRILAVTDHPVFRERG